MSSLEHQMSDRLDSFEDFVLFIGVVAIEGLGRHNQQKRYPTSESRVEALIGAVLRGCFVVELP